PRPRIALLVNVYRCAPCAATCPAVAKSMRPWRRKARISARPRPASQVAQDFAGGIAARQTGDAAAGVRARAAQVQARQRAAIVALLEQRAGAEHLVQAERAMEDV